jgi:hypothetical protein
MITLLHPIFSTFFTISEIVIILPLFVSCAYLVSHQAQGLSNSSGRLHPANRMNVQTDPCGIVGDTSPETDLKIEKMLNLLSIVFLLENVFCLSLI